MNLYMMTDLFNMKLNRLFATTITLCLITGNVLGQDDNGDPFQYNPSEKMFSQTPEQASLLKFTNIPPGNHTGVFGFSVPIYTIRGKDFSLPISIDYHGGGITVDELSGSVGIGWALNIGGISFSEEVRGERDLDGAITKLDHFDPESFDPFYGDFSQGGSPDYWDAMKMVGLQTLGFPGVPTAELQPDYFSYSLLNNSGRFIRDNLKEAHTIPKDDVKIWDVVIQSNPLPIQQRLTDKKGIDYYFSSYLQDHSPGTESSSFMPRERYS